MFKNKKQSGQDVVFEYEDNGKEKRKPPQNAGKVTMVIIIFIAAAVIFGNSFYSLKENEYAVITTLGNAAVIDQPGIHLKLPMIQKLSLVPKTINGFPIGYRPETNESVDAESFMITRDYNFVNVDFYVEYKVTDPVKYLYASEGPVDILKNLTQSYIRDTIGLYDVDSVITTGKSEIQASIKEKIITRLDSEDIGVQLVNITIQDAEPPTAEVIAAFKNVENAKQGKETSINKANQKRNEEIPAARAAVDEILKTAQATAEKRINEAKGEVARLNELYAEYTKYPLITKQRMFYEAMEDILPDLKVIIEKSNGTTQTMLPLESFTGATDTQKKAETPTTEAPAAGAATEE